MLFRLLNRLWFGLIDLSLGLIKRQWTTTFQCLPRVTCDWWWKRSFRCRCLQELTILLIRSTFLFVLTILICSPNRVNSHDFLDLFKMRSLLIFEFLPPIVNLCFWGTDFELAISLRAMFHHVSRLIAGHVSAFQVLALAQWAYLIREFTTSNTTIIWSDVPSSDLLFCKQSVWWHLWIRDVMVASLSLMLARWWNGMCDRACLCKHSLSSMISLSWRATLLPVYQILAVCTLLNWGALLGGSSYNRLMLLPCVLVPLRPWWAAASESLVLWQAWQPHLVHTLLFTEAIKRPIRAVTML